MSLNKATGGLAGTAARGVSTTAGTVKQPKQQIDQTTSSLTGVSLPGEFPDDKKNARSQDDEMPDVSFSFSGLAQSLMDKFESYVKGLITRFFPVHRREAVYKKAMSRPMAATFIICQLICCGVPLLVFLAGVLLFAAVATLLWALLSLLVLGPVLLVTGSMGIMFWGWGWAFYSFVKWVDEKFLGGIITNFLMPLSAAAEEKDEPEQDVPKHD
ncbi:hypothetical protein BGW36DRAFT_358727 [Talaromyces proteolyticus]|uniref:Uncharacterized protein n=1 Tax=Talaromyces proteolyticus TaxID=1131652 RepID=A0AAD4Q260_9EURO|nr:uncharacterized protein BGW36DRAFT_358727 [Talaromyces proteolyticus]KAH8699225.1 hypothetical protein BGW36DRAFT_358727 [Talaromyces proteolyticus]